MCLFQNINYLLFCFLGYDETNVISKLTTFIPTSTVSILCIPATLTLCVWSVQIWSMECANQHILKITFACGRFDRQHISCIIFGNVENVFQILDRNFADLVCILYLFYFCYYSFRTLLQSYQGSYGHVFFGKNAVFFFRPQGRDIFWGKIQFLTNIS